MSDLKLSILESSDLTGVEIAKIIAWIEQDWLVLTTAESLDHEDVARILFIEELQRDFGVNENAVPLILHLVDQLCHTHERLRALEGSQK